MDSPVVILGTGAEARIALDIFQASGNVVLGFVATDKESRIRDLNDVTVFAILGDRDAQKVLKDEKTQYFIAEGEIPLRKKLQEKSGDTGKRPPAVARHPMAWISPNAQTGFGCLFNAGVIVNANARIGDNTFLHSGVSVEPEAHIGNFCTLNAGVRVGAGCVIEDDVFIGTGAVIFPGVKIGKGALIGAGSVVLRPVKAGGKVHGNPATENK